MPFDTDGTPDSSPETEIDAADGEQSEEEEQAPFHQDPAWQRIIAQRNQARDELKAYKDLGAPEQVRTALNRVEYYDRLVEEAKAERPVEKVKTEDERELEAKRNEARETLFKIAPELKISIERDKQREEERVAFNDGLQSRAMGEVKRLMGTAGLPTGDEEVLEMAEMLVPLVKRDADLRAEYFTNPKQAVKQAWEKFFERHGKAASRISAAATQQKGSSLSALPRANQGGGGGSPARGTPAPQTLDELFKQNRGAF